MANFGVIRDLLIDLVELKEVPESANNHLILLQPAIPVLDDITFEIYENQSTGTSVGTMICSDSDVTYEITSGNSLNHFTINSSTGEIKTNAVLDYETISGYSLGIKVTSIPYAFLSDTAVATIHVLKVYTKCTDNVPHFQSSTNNQVGLLTVGNVILNTGTVTDYAIEWRLNSTTGTTVFLSGSGSDPLLQSQHPINSEPVQAGTLYAVLRYININGTRYSSYPYSSYGLYSPDLKTCLGTITVVSMTCSNGSAGQYSHTLSYTNAVQPSDVAYRSVSYGLDTGGTSTEIAWRFYGYDVSDRIKISYVSGANQTVIEDWVVGTDAGTPNYTSTPKIFNQQSIQTVFSLSGFTYTLGDSLLFDVYPSYTVTGNTDTNWRLDIKCFTSADPFDTTFTVASVSEVDTGATMSMTYNTGTCQNLLSVHTTSGITTSTTDVYNYMGITHYTSSDWDTDQILALSAYTGATTQWGGGVSYAPNYLLKGQLNISRNSTGHTTTYTFTDSRDYDDYKTGYTFMTGTTQWANYTSNDTLINHYIHTYVFQKISMTSGDTASGLWTHFDYSSTYTFNDTAHTITVQAVPVVINYTPLDPCDKVLGTLSSYISAVNSYYSGATFSYDTIWGVRYPFATLSYIKYDYTTYTSDWPVYVQIYDKTKSSTISMGPRWFKTGDYWQCYKYYLRVEITNTSDPTNHYKVYSKLNSDGTVAGSWTLIKTVG